MASSQWGLFLPVRNRFSGVSKVMETVQTKAHFSIPSLIAIGAAIASFFVGAFAGLLLALVAIAFGIIGIVIAMAPSVCPLTRAIINQA